MLPPVKTGTFTGSGAAQTVTLGYKPEVVLAFNQTDGDTVWCFINGMTADTAFAITGSVAAVSSEGITLVPTGFTLGTSAVTNESGKVYLYVAIGNANLDYAGA